MVTTGSSIINPWISEVKKLAGLGATLNESAQVAVDQVFQAGYRILLLYCCYSLLMNGPRISENLAEDTNGLGHPQFLGTICRQVCQKTTAMCHRGLCLCTSVSNASKVAGRIQSEVRHRRPERLVAVQTFSQRCDSNNGPPSAVPWRCWLCCDQLSGFLASDSVVNKIDLYQTLPPKTRRRISCFCEPGLSGAHCLLP